MSPLCSYKEEDGVVCGRWKTHRIHDLLSESPFTHPFQAGTEEAAPVKCRYEDKGEVCGQTKEHSRHNFTAYMKTDIDYHPFEAASVNEMQKAMESPMNDMTKTVGECAAVPGPQWAKDAFVLLAGLHEAVQWELASPIKQEIARLVGSYNPLATPEPITPHVHNFDGNGICVTGGCGWTIKDDGSKQFEFPRPTGVSDVPRCPHGNTPDIPCIECEPAYPTKNSAAPDATQERLSQIRERLKRAAEMSNSSMADIAELLNLDIPWLLTQLEEARRERDRLAGLNPAPKRVSQK